MSRSATPCQFPKSLSKSLHFSVVRGMLKQMASGASLGDDGVADVGVHTLAAGRRKMSIISLPCGSGVKNINPNVFKGRHISPPNVVRVGTYTSIRRIREHACPSQFSAHVVKPRNARASCRQMLLVSTFEARKHMHTHMRS